jgi:HK97 family phage portal protein
VHGARFRDALAVVATHVESGHQWPLIIVETPEKPADDYEHPVDDIDGAVVEAFEHFTVWRAYVHPRRIDHLLDRWRGRWGEKRVIPWDTNRPRPVAWAVRNYTTAIGAGDMSHNGDETLAQHIQNAKKQKVNVTDDKRLEMHTIAKDRPESDNYINGAMAGILSWEARGDAIAAGASRPGHAVGGGRVRLWPRRAGGPEVKSADVMPEWVWDQMQAGGNAWAPIGLERAVGLPAVLAVIRLISHAAALVPLNVHRVDGEITRRALDTWQWRLLNTRPGAPPMTPFALKADLAANFAGRGNAYVRKLKPALVGPGRPRVIELMPLNAARVKPERAKTGDVIFRDSTGEKPVTRGTDEIIQIRSFSVGDGLEGLSPITAARLLVSAGLQRAQFEERHLANGIFPGIGLKFPEGVTPEQGELWIKAVEKQHKGAPKAGKVIGVGGGADLVPIPISLEDAQFAEVTRLTIEQAASMHQVPISFFTGKPTPDEWRMLITFALGPVLVATAQAFSADLDLFDPTADDEVLDVAPDPDVLLNLDPKTKAEIQHMQVQDGLRLVDELRAKDGYGPLPAIPKDWTQAPGRVPQITPVGGAPNPTAQTTPPAEVPPA